MSQTHNSNNSVIRLTQYLVVYKLCYEVCFIKLTIILANASYDGVYKYGQGEHALPVYQWSYDYGLVPIRSVRLVTKDYCYPVTDMAGVVVKNSK